MKRHEQQGDSYDNRNNHAAQQHPFALHSPSTSTSTLATAHPYDISPAFSCKSVEAVLADYSRNAPSQHPQFRLRIRQHPRYGLAVGDDSSAQKNAKFAPLDPPPICELVPESNLAARYLSATELSVRASLVDANAPHDDVGSISSSSKSEGECLIGTRFESPFIAPCTQAQDECFFIFSDLSVRRVGRYRLRFDVIERVNLTFQRRMSVYSEPFTVASDKSAIPNTSVSSALLQAIARRGLRVRITKPSQTTTTSASSSHSTNKPSTTPTADFSSNEQLPKRRKRTPPESTFVPQEHHGLPINIAGRNQLPSVQSHTTYPYHYDQRMPPSTYPQARTMTAAYTEHPQYDGYSTYGSYAQTQHSSSYESHDSSRDLPILTGARPAVTLSDASSSSSFQTTPRLSPQMRIPHLPQSAPSSSSAYHPLISPSRRTDQYAAESVSERLPVRPAEERQGFPTMHTSLPVSRPALPHRHLSRNSAERHDVYLRPVVDGTETRMAAPSSSDRATNRSASSEKLFDLPSLTLPPLRSLSLRNEFSSSADQEWSRNNGRPPRPELIAGEKSYAHQASHDHHRSGSGGPLSGPPSWQPGPPSLPPLRSPSIHTHDAHRPQQHHQRGFAERSDNVSPNIAGWQTRERDYFDHGDSSAAHGEAAETDRHDQQYRFTQHAEMERREYYPSTGRGPMHHDTLPAWNARFLPPLSAPTGSESGSGPLVYDERDPGRSEEQEWRRR